MNIVNLYFGIMILQIKRTLFYLIERAQHEAYFSSFLNFKILKGSTKIRGCMNFFGSKVPIDEMISQKHFARLGFLGQRLM